MEATKKSGGGARIAFLVLFIIGAGAVFVTTAGPLSGPAMSWNEAGVGLVPGALLFLLFHLLHVRKLGQADKRGQAAVWWSLATVFLLGLGSLMVFAGNERLSSAESQLRSARSRPYGAYGSGYGSSGDTYLLQRDVSHYEGVVNVGWGMLGLSLLFMIGTGVAVSRARAASRMQVAVGPQPTPGWQSGQPLPQQPGPQ